MLKNIERSNAKKIVVNKADFEVVSVNSDNRSNSPTCELANIIEDEIKNALSLKEKSFNYKILVTAEESKGKIVNILNKIVLLDTEENLATVMDSLTENGIKFELMKNLPDNKETSCFEDRCQFWCNRIQYYFENEFGFTGNTKINASSWDGYIKSFDIVLSGKGVNDDIVSKMKILSKKITQEMLMYYEDNDIYITLDDLLKS